MTTIHKRSKPLHNFTFPCLKWGSQRYLRCPSVDRRSPTSKSDESPASRKRELEPERKPARGSEKRKRLPEPIFDGADGDGGIDAVRQKLMLDLKTAANRMKDAILKNEVAEEEEARESLPPPTKDATAAAVVVRPWNLRKRRAVCKGPVEGKKLNCSPVRTASSCAKSKKVKFSVPLSKKEVEEDFMVLVGHRPSRRPNKRPRNVQRELDTLFPGLWLT